MFAHCFFVQFACQGLDILIVHVGAQLKVAMVQFLKSCPFLLLTDFNQIFHILDKVEKLLIILIVVEGDNRDSVFQLIKVGISSVVDQENVFQLSVLEHSKVFDVNSFFCLPALPTE